MSRRSFAAPRLVAPGGTGAGRRPSCQVPRRRPRDAAWRVRLVTLKILAEASFTGTSLRRHDLNKHRAGRCTARVPASVRQRRRFVPIRAMHYSAATQPRQEHRRPRSALRCRPSGWRPTRIWLPTGKEPCALPCDQIRSPSLRPAGSPKPSRCNRASICRLIRFRAAPFMSPAGSVPEPHHDLTTALASRRGSRVVEAVDSRDIPVGPDAPSPSPSTRTTHSTGPRRRPGSRNASAPSNPRCRPRNRHHVQFG